MYTRIGASEEFRSRELGSVDMSTGAASFVDAYPGCRYPAVMVGSSNGALTNLAVAARVPWLPDTVLGPVAGAHDRPDDVLAFGASVVATLLRRNPRSFCITCTTRCRMR